MGRATRWFKGLFGVKNKEQGYSSRSVDDFSTSNGDKLKDKKRWSFGKPAGKDDFSEGLRSVPADNAAWLMSSYVSGKDQNKHAIAVAAATAAAADAAVAAAQAAVAVVRLTSHGRGTLFSGGRERWAALKIQSCFRGYLARRALRALKGLVKIQALVRGFLVRKRATATLYSMQALIRAQAAVRLQRARRSLSQDNRPSHENRARKSNDRSAETGSEFHSKRNTDVYLNNGYEGSPKIVEIDTFKTRSRSRRINPSPASDSGEDYPYSSPLPYPVPLRTKIVECHDNFDWTYSREDCKFPTAQSTPRFQSSMLCNVPTTPSRSVCGDGLYSNCPNYMSNTQSFKAKLRSHSAPKQRPETGPKKRLCLSEVMASRTSFSGVKMQRSCTTVQEVLDL